MGFIKYCVQRYSVFHINDYILTGSLYRFFEFVSFFNNNNNSNTNNYNNNNNDNNNN